MKAIVFAAGLGTRLKPFTDYHPKALAEICGRPMLGIVIERLIKVGVDEIVVNVHHFADQIEEYLKRNSNFGITIHVSDERSRLLDTGGGILTARRWLDGDEPFIVHNSDILTDVDLKEMLSASLQHHAIATLLVAHRDTKRYLLFDPSDMHMKGWTNIETGELRPTSLLSVDNLSHFAFGGVHIVSPSIFPYLEEFAKSVSELCDAQIPKFSIMDFYISSCPQHIIYGYVPSKPYHWHDIGKPAALKTAEKDLKAMNF